MAKKQLEQTTHTFQDAGRADRFAAWLRTHTGDEDMGEPRFINRIDLGVDGAVCIEYSHRGDFVPGVAVGVNL